MFLWGDKGKGLSTGPVSQRAFYEGLTLTKLTPLK